MTKTHIILVGFGDVGTRIFPSIMQINEDNRRNKRDSLEISIVDILPLNEIYDNIKLKLKERFGSYSEIEYDEKNIFEFLVKNYFQDKKPGDTLIPEGLIKRIRPERTIVYLALDPDNYYDALEKYLPFGNIFALEKPLAKKLETATLLLNYTKQYSDFLGKQFIPIDHYLGKDALKLFYKISQNPKFGTIIDDSNLIIFSFLEKKIGPASEQPYFASTGIIADMMPHVSVLLKKILDTKYLVEPVKVSSSFLDSYQGIPCVETYAEIELVLTEENRPPRKVLVRIGKGLPEEDRTVTFVNSVGDILSMKLPHSELKEGEVLLKNVDMWIKVDTEKHTPKKWDNSYYNIIRSLMDNESDSESSIFLTIEDAQETVRMIEEIKAANINEGSYKKDEYLFSWDEIPGNDSERLIDFLKQKYSIDWVKIAKIAKIDDNKTIRASIERNLLSLSLNNEKNKVNLRIKDGRIDEFIVKTENGKLKIYRDEMPHYLDFNWKNYSWESKTDYAVIFNFNGVLLENRDINIEAWKWVLDQLRIKNYHKGLLKSLINSGLHTKEILLYMLCKYYKSNLDGSSTEILANSWAKAKEQQYIADIIRKNAKEMNGAKELLDVLSNKKIKIGLYSIFPRHSVLQILHYIGVKQFFNVVVTPEIIRADYRNQNPFLGCLNEIIDRMGVEKKNCFLLDDSSGCIDMAMEQGVTCIGFGLEENREEFKSRGAICVVKDHMNLVDIFEKSQKWTEVVDKLKELDMKK